MKIFSIKMKIFPIKMQDPLKETPSCLPKKISLFLTWKFKLKLHSEHWLCLLNLKNISTKVFVALRENTIQ